MQRVQPALRAPPRPGPTASASGTPAATTRTVTDDLGRKVDVPVEAKRVVALSPSIVELMYAVGAEPVGRPDSATYPPEATAVPDFGSSYTPNFEEIVAMQPDLIIADAIIHASVMSDIEALGVPVYALKVDSFDTVTAGLRTVGALTGHADAGETAGQKAGRQAGGGQGEDPGSETARACSSWSPRARTSSSPPGATLTSAAWSRSSAVTTSSQSSRRTSASRASPTTAWRRSSRRTPT